MSEEFAALDVYQQEMMGRIGHKHRRHLGVVDGRMIRRYALAIGDTDPAHFDETAARSAGYAGVVAPPNLLSAIVEWGTGLPESELTPDGIARPPSTGSLQVMGAGEELELLLPVTEGLDLYAEEVVEKVERKQGRNGPLVFVTTRHDFVDESGTVYNRNRRTVLARPERGVA